MNGLHRPIGTGVLALLAACLWLASARAQSSQTLAGMQAYNRGDVATAYRLLRGEADAGDPEAQVNLGYLYARGQGVRADQWEAFRLYLLSANQGDGEGMNALGYKYEFGTGVTRDMGQAIRWYCAAVTFGNPRAMNNLALVLARGEGLPRDIEEARSLWRQSAAQGHTNSMYNLGWSYLGGGGDPAEAIRWMMLAAKNGQRAAQGWVRANGYTGPLPLPVDTAAMMVPTMRHAAGYTKACGTPVS